MDDKIVRREYGLEQIRRIFGAETEEKNNFCLFPLLESVVYSLYQDIPRYGQNLGITYWRMRPNQNSIYPWLELVVEGKIVDFEVNSVNIDEVDDDEMIWSIGGIVFSGPEAQVRKIFLAVEKIVAAYDFDKLKTMAAKRLKKEKLYHLGSLTRYFYGV